MIKLPVIWRNSIITPKTENCGGMIEKSSISFHSHPSNTGKIIAHTLALSLTRKIRI